MAEFAPLGEGPNSIYDPEVEAAYTAQHHWGIDNDPFEPYSGVAALFNGDLHATEPDYAPRDEWMVVSPHIIRMARENTTKP